MPSIKSDLPRQSSRPIGPQRPDGFASFDRDGVRSRVPLNRAFLMINLGLIIAVCGIFIYFRWDDLGNRDVRGIAFAAFDFISHPTLYARAYIEKPPLAFLMYLPMAFLPAIAGPAIYFAVVIAGEALLLRWLLRELRFDEAACLGGTAFFLAATLLKYQLDYVSLSHLSNLLILGACITAIRGSTRGIIISGLLIAASFYIRQNNVILALYPLVLGRFTQPRTLVVYTTSMLVGFLALFSFFCLLSDVHLFVYTTFIYPFKYVDMGIGHPRSALWDTVFYFGKPSLIPLLLFFVLWSISALTNTHPPVSGRQMVVLFGAVFIVMVAPNKPYPHYQGYFLIWLGLLGAWAVHVLALPLLRRRQRWLAYLAAVCAVVLVGAMVKKEVRLNSQLASAKSRLDFVLPEIRSALASRPGHPTLQVFDPIYTDHETYDGLLFLLTGATPATPLIFTPFWADWFASALPPSLRDQWGLLARTLPDVIVLIDVKEGRDLIDNVGPNFSTAVRQFLALHGYRTRTIAKEVIIAERP